MNKGYNALTGEEIKKVILAEVERSLDASDMNSPAITYPMVGWHWKLSIFQKAGETREREISAGNPKAEEVVASEGVDETPIEIEGGTERFKNNPPSPSEVRQAENLEAIGT